MVLYSTDFHDVVNMFPSFLEVIRGVADKAMADRQSALSVERSGERDSHRRWSMLRGLKAETLKAAGSAATAALDAAADGLASTSQSFRKSDCYARRKSCKHMNPSAVAAANAAGEKTGDSSSPEQQRLSRRRQSSIASGFFGRTNSDAAKEREAEAAIIASRVSQRRRGSAMGQLLFQQGGAEQARRSQAEEPDADKAAARRDAAPATAAPAANDERASPRRTSPRRSNVGDGSEMFNAGASKSNQVVPLSDGAESHTLPAAAASYAPSESVEPGQYQPIAVPDYGPIDI